MTAAAKNAHPLMTTMATMTMATSLTMLTVVVIVPHLITICVCAGQKDGQFISANVNCT